jgi:phage repressor protein C with HTH and peptisase S24 domain
MTKNMLDKLRQGIVTEVSIKILKPFIEAYPQVNVNYILTGRGSMFNQEQKTQEKVKIESSAQPLGVEITMLVPLVNQYAYAGYLSGYQDNTYLESLPTIPFTVDHEARGNYVAFEVKGDSMNNGTEESYLEGDKLFCREIPQHLWVDSKLHIRKWDFVIVHEDGILVKRIIDHDVENHTITVHSLNDFYPDKVIDLAEVRQIFNVVEMQRPKRR